MWRLLINAVAGAIASSAAGAPTPALPPPAVVPVPTPILPGRPDIPAPTATLQPPPGGDFDRRLDAFAADLEAVLRLGLLTETEAAGAAVQLAALREDLAAVRARNGGKLPDADAARLDGRVQTLRKQTGELAAASRLRQAGGR